MKLSSLRARRGSEAQETEVGFALRGFLDSTSSADDPHTEVSSAIGYPSDVSNVSAGDEETSNRHDREDYPDTGILSAGENSGSFAGVSVPVEEETLKRCEREDNPTIEASSPVSHAHDVDALFAMFLDESSKRGFRAECSSIDASRPKFWRQNFTNTAVPNEDEVSQHQDREAQSILACPAIISDTSIPDESELPQNQKTEEAPKHIQTRHNFDERALANMKGDKTTHFGGEYTTYSTNSEDGALLDAWVLHLIRVSNGKYFVRLIIRISIRRIASREYSATYEYVEQPFSPLFSDAVPNTTNTIMSTTSFSPFSLASVDLWLL